jgi:hypothetical protein
VVSLASVTAPVTATHDASVSTPGTATTTVTAGTDASVFAGGDVLGAVDATAGNASVTSGGIVSDTVTAGNDATVYAMGTISDDVTAGEDASVTSWSDVTSAVQAGRDALVAAQGQLPGNVSAVRDASILVAGDHSGNTKAGGTATIEVGGAQMGTVSAGGDATVVSRGAFAAIVNTGGEADVTGFTSATGTVTAGGDASLASWGPISAATVAGAIDASAWAGGDLAASVTATAGDASTDSAGAGNVSVTAGRDAEASAFNGLLATVNAGRDADLSSLAGATLNVTAGRDTSLFTNGALIASVASGGSIDGISLGDVSGSFSAGLDDSVMTSGNALSTGVSAGRDAQLIVWGNADNPAVSGANSAFAFSYGSMVATLTSSAGWAQAISAGPANVTVGSAGDATVDALSTVAAQVTAGADATIFAAGALTGKANAGGNAWIAGLANIGAGAPAPFLLTTGHDATLYAVGNLAAIVTAGHDLKAETYGDLVAGFSAGHDVTLAWAKGDISGTIAAANDVDRVAAYGQIDAAISAGVGTSSGSVVLVEAYGPIAGTITAGASIGPVQSHSAISATLTAPTVGQVDAFDHYILTDYPATPAVSLASIWAGLADDFRSLADLSSGVAADKLGQLAALAASAAAAFASYQPTLGDAGLAAAGIRDAVIQLQISAGQVADQLAQNVVGAQIAQRDGWSLLQVASALAAANFQGALHQLQLDTNAAVADFGEREIEMAALGAVAKSGAMDDRNEAIAKWNNERDALRPAQFDAKAKALILDRIHTALTILSLVDKTGAVDIIEGLLYLYERRWKEAGFQLSVGFLLGDINSLRKLASKAGDVFGMINGVRRFGRGLVDAAGSFGQAGFRFLSKVENIAESTLRAALKKCPDAASCFVAGTLIWLDEDYGHVAGSLDVFRSPLPADSDVSDDSWLGTLLLVGIGITTWRGVNRAQRRRQTILDAAFAQISDAAGAPAIGQARLRTNLLRPAARLGAAAGETLRGPCSTFLLQAATEGSDGGEAWMIDRASGCARSPMATLDVRRHTGHSNTVENTPMELVTHRPTQSPWLRGNPGSFGFALLAILLSFSGFWHFHTRQVHIANPNTTVTSPPSNSAAMARGETHSQLLAIEEVRIGNRVRAKNPAPEKRGELDLQRVDEQTSKAIRLAIPCENGSTVSAEILRPTDWIEAIDAQVGSAIDLDLPEFGIEDPALVISIDPCPTIKPGHGRIVTGTFRHKSNSVVNLHVEGAADPIGVTSNHRFWSESRHSFVSAAELMRGEQLLGIAGPRSVVSVAPRPGLHDVYNLEVEFEHVYHVGDDGILVHNACAWKIYEAFISSLYGGQLALSSRRFVSLFGKGVADNIAGAGADVIAIEAKYIGRWSRSIYNPNSPFSRGLAFPGSAQYAAKEQARILQQAQSYSAAFGDVIYHTNSKAFANYLRRRFASLPNITIIVTPLP